MPELSCDLICTFGGCFGRTMTRRSPYLLSVLNIGASELTSHLYRPVEATVRLAR